MANRIVQAVYDLKDNIVGKLRNIGDALRGHKAESDRTTAAVNRNNDRLSASYAASAEGIAKFRNAIVALGAFVGLSRVKDELVAVLETGERFDDLDKALATAFGGVEEGRVALERLTEFAKGVPNALEDIAKEAIKLREGGFDPFDGTLQALIDNQQALDKSTEELSTTVETLSKANIKGELSMKAIVSLTQQGIPVFELLARATGMSEERLRRLAETGQLGKESIRQLVTEIGKLRAGAAEGELGDLDGQLQKIRDTANRFLADIARSGALDFFRSELERLNASVSEAAESGKLQQVAQNVSDGIIATAKAVGSAIKFVYDYSGALITLGKVYVAIKVTSFIVSLAALTQRMATSIAATVALTSATTAAGAAAGTGAAAFGVFGRAILAVATALRANPLLAALAAAAAYTTSKILELAEATVDYIAATKLQKQTEEEAADAKAALIAQIDGIKKANEQYANSVVLTREELQSQTAQQLRAYDSQLQGAVNYYRAARTEAKLFNDAAGMQEATAKLAAYTAALIATRDAAQSAGSTLNDKVSPAARQVADSFAGAAENAAAVADRIGELFKDFDQLNTTQLGDIALGLVDVARESRLAGVAVRDGLAGELRKLSGEDILRFQSSALAAFGEFKVSAADADAILRSTLLVSLEKLGVAPSKFGMGMSATGRDAVAAFAAITENALATANQIEAAFTAATKSASTTADLEALGNALKAAADQGRIGFEQTERAMLSLKNRLRELRAETDPLADQFSKLGIKSQAALNDSRDAARDAFEAVVNGARRGLAAQEDIRRAFEAYARAARDAAAQSTQAVRDQVEAQLQARATALGLTDVLKAMGATGAQAGADTAAAANAAADALGNLKGAADDAADSAAELSDSGSRAASSLDNVASSGADAAFSLGDVSKAFADAANGAAGLDRIAFNELTDQRQRADELLQSLQQQNAEYDEQAQRIESLRNQFTYLGDETLRRLADEQRALDENIRRREEETQRRKQEQSQNDSGKSSSGGGVVRLELVHKVDGGSSGSLSETQFDTMLQNAGRSGKLGRYFNDSLRNAMRNAGIGGGR